MGRKNAGIIVKVKKEFVNTSRLASMSYYNCGQAIPTGAEFVACEWCEDEIGSETVKLFKNIFDESQLKSQDIDLIISTLIDISMNKDRRYAYYEKQRICDLVYVESLMNQGLVEVEWYDWM